MPHHVESPDKMPRKIEADKMPNDHKKVQRKCQQIIWHLPVGILSYRHKYCKQCKE